MGIRVESRRSILRSFQDVDRCRLDVDISCRHLMAFLAKKGTHNLIGSQSICKNVNRCRLNVGSLIVDIARLLLTFTPLIVGIYSAIVDIYSAIVDIYSAIVDIYSAIVDIYSAIGDTE